MEVIDCWNRRPFFYRELMIFHDNSRENLNLPVSFLKIFPQNIFKICKIYRLSSTSYIIIKHCKKSQNVKIFRVGRWHQALVATKRWTFFCELQFWLNFLGSVTSDPHLVINLPPWKLWYLFKSLPTIPLITSHSTYSFQRGASNNP